MLRVKAQYLGLRHERLSGESIAPRPDWAVKFDMSETEIFESHLSIAWR